MSSAETTDPKTIQVPMTPDQARTTLSALRTVGRAQAAALVDPFQSPLKILDASERLAEVILLFADVLNRIGEQP